MYCPMPQHACRRPSRSRRTTSRTVRTGRANPQLFQKILVSYYGTPDAARAARVAAEPRGAHARRHALRQERAEGHRAGHPRHPEPRREPVATTATSSASRCPSSPRSAARSTSRSCAPRPKTPRSSVRNIRRKAKDDLDALKSEVGDDEVARGEKELEHVTKAHVDAIDDALKRKEAELLEV